MKTAFGIPSAAAYFTLLMVLQTAAAPAASPDPQITKRGPHHRVIERTFTEALSDGTAAERKTSYTELGTSMHFWKDGGWQESKAQFRLYPGGAVAEEGPLRLIIAPDVSQEPLVDLLTSDSQRFQASPRWLGYYDRATGRSIMIAAVKPCAGQLVEPNVIVFPDAFDDLHAALKFTYHPWGMEQEVLLLESGPLRPEDYGLNGNPSEIVLEMWSEFHTWPEGGTATASVESGLNDVKLVFGETQLGIGKAFSLADKDNSIAVGKSWVKVDGQRQFLIEAVRQTDLAPLLAGLPLQAQVNNPAQRAKGLAQRSPVGTGRAGLLAQGIERLKTREKRTQTASIQPARAFPGPGVSIDYSIITTISGLRLKGDTTYLVTNSVTLSGTTTIEGGAVIKFSNVTNAGSNRMLITGPIDCQTSPYRPAIFTAKDDDTVGEVISGSTGSPGTNRYAGRALELNAASTTYNLHDLHFRHTDNAVYVTSSSASLNLSHTQIGYANYAIRNAHPNGVARNLLVHDSLYGIGSSTTGTNRLEHVTFHRVGTLLYSSWGQVYLTNCLLICVTNGVVYTGSNVETNLSDTGIFQTVGAGSRYLASQSAYRNAGTTNIDPTLLADIKLRTTYPPLVLTNDIVSDTTLYMQAGRDVDSPDLGYHPDALDYCWSGLNLTNATLRLANGVAVAVYGTNGIRLQNGAKFISEGTPTALNHLVRYQAVQEEPTNWGATAGTMSLFGAISTTTLPEVRLRFTDISLLADAPAKRYVIADLAAYVIGALELKNSTLRGGYFDVRPTIAATTLTQTIGLTNSLIQRGSYTFNAAYSGDCTPVVVHLHNNLVKDCTLSLNNMTNTTSWTAHDNFFDTVTLSGPNNSYGLLVNTHNGYLSTTTLPNASNTKNIPYADYQTGPLGSFYYPTSGTNLYTLVGAGSRNADAAGLYHFTTTTNQVKETNSTVDIGFHYVAVNSSGQPIDTDGDGAADYAEDLTGNGSVNSGETDWSNASDWGLRVLITRPRSGSQMP